MQKWATATKLRAVEPSVKGDLTPVLERARAAQRQWAALPLEERARRMRSLARGLADQGPRLASVVVEETGKLAAEFYLSELVVAVNTIRYFTRIAPKVLRPARVGTGLLLHKRALKLYEPLGVVGVISPWNYPFVLSVTPLVAALLAGNAVILKPSEFTPKTGLAVGELAAEACRVPDIIQVVTGAGDVGRALTALPLDKVVFTGSVATGKAVARACAENLTPVVLELGGKDPLIVCEDADLDRAARAAVWGAFTNAGQTCMAVERVYAVGASYEPFLQRVLDLTAPLLAADPPQVGAMISERQVRVVEEQLSDAVEKGARILLGGRRRTEGSRPGFEPTVVVNVNHGMRLMQEETFGPVLPVMACESEEEAIELANDSPYGLNAAVFSTDRGKALRIAERLASGNVCINDVMVSYAIPALPYGGRKASGFGYTHGAEALWEMSAVKSVALDRVSPRTELQWYPLTRPKEKLGLLLARLLAR
jgi:acyl-CoA reductase-like NAD-dependent aldehyde dehydrogenase